MKSIKVCEYSRSRSFHDDLILQDQASGERSQDQWSSGLAYLSICEHDCHVEQSVNPDFAHKILFPLSMEAPHEISLS